MTEKRNKFLFCLSIRPLSARLAAFFMLVLLTGCLAPSYDESFQRMFSATNLPEDHLPQRGSSLPGAVQLLDHGLTADEAVRLALTNNPRIRARYDELDIAAADRLASRLLPNPLVEGSMKRPDSDWDSSDGQKFEVTAEVDAMRIILLPLNSSIGEANQQKVEMDVAAAVQSLAFNTRVAYYHVLAAEQRLKMRKQYLEAADAGSEMAGRLRKAGNIKKLRKLNEEALREEAELAVLAAELEVVNARKELGLLMGLSDPSVKWKTADSLPIPESVDSDDESEIKKALDSSFQLAIVKAQLKAAESKLTIARVRSIVPQLHVGIDAEREPDRTWMFGPMITVELPLADFGQAARPRAAAKIRLLQHRYAALAVEVSIASSKALARLKTAKKRTEKFREKLIPLREKITHQTQLQYNAMQLGVFQLLQAKQAEIAIRGNYIDELLNYWIFQTELEQIRNGLLVGDTSTVPRDGMTSGQRSGSKGGH